MGLGTYTKNLLLLSIFGQLDMAGLFSRPEPPMAGPLTFHFHGQSYITILHGSTAPHGSSSYPGTPYFPPAYPVPSYQPPQSYGTVSTLLNTVLLYLQKIAYLLPVPTDQMQALGNSAYDYVSEHKWSLMLKGGIGFYAYLQYQLIRLSMFLLAPERWINWKRDTSTSQLHALPPERLRAELLAAYHNRTNTDQQSSFDGLTQELESEIKALTKYARWATRVSTISEMQHRCALLCEGCFPSVVGIKIGCIFRIALDTFLLERILYINAGLLRLIPEHLERLHCLRTALTGSAEKK